MSRKRRSTIGPPEVEPCVLLDMWQERADTILAATLQSDRLARDERGLIVGPEAAALASMCLLLRRGVPRVILVRDRWPVAPHSITLIIVPSLAVRGQILQAIEMAPRALAASGRLVLWLLASRTAELRRRIEGALRRSSFALTQEDTALGSLLCAAPGLPATARIRSRPEPAARRALLHAIA